MIQEKDFLYRVPVKTAPITTPRGQIRNPEILVDLEGGEFMHGNILDANSTNKLINQSVKDAVDNKLIESGYVTKDLLEAETSARTKGDEDLSAKIKAEQTRAEGKEKEISDKLAIVNGDSNTEGSFRKAIADVVAAAPEDLDTLKEIADKLAGNDDLHTALNQAITEKADASALLNEVTRATGAESGLQAAIATKADATALSNYVLTTALNKQVDTLNTAISAKQDKGNYMEYSSKDDGGYTIDCELNTSEPITIDDKAGHRAFVTTSGIQANDYNTGKGSQLTSSSLVFSNASNDIKPRIIYTADGITSNWHNDCLATSDGTFKPISDFALKTELTGEVSDILDDYNFMSQQDADSRYAFADTVDSLSVGLSKKQNKITVNEVDITDIETADITKLRTIVTNLINALSESDLIRKTITIE